MMAQQSSVCHGTAHCSKLLKRKGEGTFSEVLAAQNIKSGDLCAIKCMKQTFESLDQVNNLREIQALRRLSPHNNIIKLHEVLYDKPTGRLALVFELMSFNMYELIRGRRRYLDPGLVKIYSWQMLQAVAHCHKKGIFHRDIKPENVLLSPTVDVHEGLKLADFGSCRGIYSKQPYTEYISTRWYRAPECLLTDGYYGPEMDIWGVACVMFEISALFPLFPGTDERDQIKRIHAILGTPSGALLAKFKAHANSHIDFSFAPERGTGIAAAAPHLDAQLVDLLNKMLAYDPKQRHTAEQCLAHTYFDELRSVPLPPTHDAGDARLGTTTTTAGSGSMRSSADASKVEKPEAFEKSTDAKKKELEKKPEITHEPSHATTKVLTKADDKVEAPVTFKDPSKTTSVSHSGHAVTVDSSYPSFSSPTGAAGSKNTSHPVLHHAVAAPSHVSTNVLQTSKPSPVVSSNASKYSDPVKASQQTNAAAKDVRRGSNASALRSAAPGKLKEGSAKPAQDGLVLNITSVGSSKKPYGSVASSLRSTKPVADTRRDSSSLAAGTGGTQLSKSTLRPKESEPTKAVPSNVGAGVGKANNLHQVKSYTSTDVYLRTPMGTTKSGAAAVASIAKELEQALAESGPKMPAPQARLLGLRATDVVSGAREAVKGTESPSLPMLSHVSKAHVATGVKLAPVGKAGGAFDTTESPYSSTLRVGGKHAHLQPLASDRSGNREQARIQLLQSLKPTDKPAGPARLDSLHATAPIIRGSDEGKPSGPHGLKAIRPGPVGPSVPISPTSTDEVRMLKDVLKLGADVERRALPHLSGPKDMAMQSRPLKLGPLKP